VELGGSGTPRDEDGLGSGAHNPPHNFPVAGAGCEREFAGFRDYGATTEDGEVLALDGMRISSPPRLKSSRSTANCESTFFTSGQPRRKTCAGAIHFKLHHLAKGIRVEVWARSLFGHSELTQVFERQIDSAFGVVDVRPARSSRVAGRCRCNRKAAGARGRDNHRGRERDGLRDWPE